MRIILLSVALILAACNKDNLKSVVTLDESKVPKPNSITIPDFEYYEKNYIFNKKYSQDRKNNTNNKSDR